MIDDIFISLPSSLQHTMYRYIMLYVILLWWWKQLILLYFAFHALTVAQSTVFIELTKNQLTYMTYDSDAITFRCEISMRIDFKREKHVYEILVFSRNHVWNRVPTSYILCVCPTECLPCYRSAGLGIGMSTHCGGVEGTYPP